MKDTAVWCTVSSTAGSLKDTSPVVHSQQYSSRTDNASGHLIVMMMIVFL